MGQSLADEDLDILFTPVQRQGQAKLTISPEGVFFPPAPGANMVLLSLSSYRQESF